jgi:hypothetical protein
MRLVPKGTWVENMSKPKVTSGGGQYKEPVIVEAKRVFGIVIFTFADACTLVSGYCRTIQSDLVSSGKLKKVKTKSGEIYHAWISGDIRVYAGSPAFYKFVNENRTDGDTDSTIH